MSIGCISTAGTFPKNKEPLEELCAFSPQGPGSKLSSKEIFLHQKSPCSEQRGYSTFKRTGTLRVGLAGLNTLISRVLAAFYFRHYFFNNCRCRPQPANHTSCSVCLELQRKFNNRWTGDEVQACLLFSCAHKLMCKNSRTF